MNETPAIDALPAPVAEAIATLLAYAPPPTETRQTEDRAPLSVISNNHFEPPAVVPGTLANPSLAYQSPAVADEGRTPDGINVVTYR